MLRIIFIWIGTYSAYHVDTQSASIMYSRIFSIINALYLYYLFKNFVGFLKELGATGTNSSNPDGIELAFDVLSLVYANVSDKYSGEFDFMGAASGYIEDFVVLVEFVLVIVTFYQECQLVAYLSY